jgi:hypothetical protein
LANEAEDNSHRKQCQQPPLFQQHHCSAQKLHYTPKLIKTLNPTKALLIVENELHAYYDHDGANGAEDGQLEGVQERRTQWKTKLDALVKENEALIQQQQQQKERRKEHEIPEKL